MSEQGHTPGPWIISSDELNSVDIVIRGIADNYVGKNKNQIHVAIVTQLPDEAVSWWSPKTLEEAKANARLIAQAPTLLRQRDALVEIMSFVIDALEAIPDKMKGEIAGEIMQNLFDDTKLPTLNGVREIVAEWKKELT